MRSFFKLIIAFIKKDFINEASYKFSFLLGILYLLANILIFFFISKMYGDKLNIHLLEFQTTYFSYVFLSIIFFNFIGPGFSSLSSKIRTEQYQGTLESLIIAPLNTKILIISLSVWTFVYSFFEFLIYIFIGIFAFSINFANINFFSFSIVSILSIANFISLGILSSCFVILFKKGNPINWLLTPIEGMLGGVYFPISVLPDFAQKISQFLPITHSIRALQLAVYKNASFSELKYEIFILSVFLIILGPLSVKLFDISIKKALRNGQISNY